MSNKFEVKSSKFKILVAVDLSAFFCYIKTMAMWRSGYAEVCPASRDLAQRDKTLMHYYVYILKSLKNNDIYVGSTANLFKRIALHNQGRVKSTKGYKPWELLEHYEYDSRSEAVQQEKHIKQHQQKELLKKKFGLVPKW